MSRRRRIHWSGPLPHKGDPSVTSWEDPPADYVPNLPPVVVPERSWRDWWPTDPAESDVWAAETLAITEKVWRRQGLTIYFGRRNQEVKDELHGWLIEQALKIREHCTYLPESDDPLDTWCGVLYSLLAKNAAWYFAEVREKSHLWDGSLDQLEEREAETGYHVARHALHGIPVEMTDPERFVILLESLERREDPRGGEAKADGLCIEYGCYELTEARRRCHTHHMAWLLLHARGRCTVEGCEDFANQKGLCNAHYREQKLADPDRPHCIEDGCDKPAISRQLCDTHYRARRRNGGSLPERSRPKAEGPCSLDGCDRPAKRKGLCRAHAAEARDAAMPPCTVEGCEDLQKARGLCWTHYHRALRAEAPPCTVQGCEKPSRTAGMCAMHYARKSKWGDPLIATKAEYEARQRGEAA